MKLTDTITMMASADYKDRFFAEYWQTKIRAGKLREMIEKHEAGTLDFTPTVPIDLLKTQLTEMQSYLTTLETRAELENVALDEKPIEYDIDLMGTKDDPTLQVFWMYLRKTMHDILEMPIQHDIKYSTEAEFILRMLKNFAQAAGDITVDAVEEYEQKKEKK